MKDVWKYSMCCKSQGRLLYECHWEHSRDGFGLKVYNDIRHVTHNNENNTILATI